jgi:hypothetical protein
MLRPGVRSRLCGALLLLCACASGGETLLEPAACFTPQVVWSAVAPGTNNVLTGVVTAEVREADSLAVRFGEAGLALDGLTPALDGVAGVTMAPVLGLRASTSYSLQLIAFNRCGMALGETLSLTTGALPADLPSYVAAGSVPSPGYVVLAAGNYGLVIDNSGRVVWYHRFPNGPGLNFQAQPNGRYVARPNAAVAGQPALWLELDPLGNVTRTLGCARGLQPRMHDFIGAADGSYWVLCDEVRTVDLEAAGGDAHAQVLGTAVQHLTANGDLLFEWSPFDHLEVKLGDLTAADLAGPVINWTHGNALDLDGDGNLLVSFRNLSTLVKIDTRTGAVVWRMGGSHNEFAFENTAMPAFMRQHSLRVTGNGRMLLLDNLGEPASRAERYDFDEAGRSVRLTGTYTSSGSVIAQVGGTAQDLPGGRTLVSFGNGASVEEYDAAGNVVWRLEGNPGYIFRAQRVQSLYRPGTGDPR